MGLWRDIKEDDGADRFGGKALATLTHEKLLEDQKRRMKS